jgi:hypothetical protein
MYHSGSFSDSLDALKVLCLPGGDQLDYFLDFNIEKIHLGSSLHFLTSVHPRQGRDIGIYPLRIGVLRRKLMNKEKPFGLLCNNREI